LACPTWSKLLCNAEIIKMGPNWYVLFTRSQREKVAAKKIASHGFETFCPETSELRRMCGQLYERKGPLFNRYIFAYGDLAYLADAVRRSGFLVNRILDFGFGPVTVADYVIEEIRSRVGPDGLVRLAPRGVGPSGYKPGEKVIVDSYPFRDVDGLFVEDDSDGRVTVLLNILGRPAKMAFERHEVNAHPCAESLV
jgi:transcription antitermination factor NusG